MVRDSRLQQIREGFFSLVGGGETKEKEKEEAEKFLD